MLDEESEQILTVTLQDIEDAIKKFDPKDLEEELAKAPKKLSVLCAGATVGKSTLLNGLMGVCKADLFPVGESLKRGTLEVTERTFTLRGIAITIWDTPGMEGSRVDESYLKEIKEKCADFDIFLYCIKADETRAIELTDDRSSLLKFTKLFGPKLWRNAVVALTFSNKIEDRCEEEAEIDPKINVEKEFKKKIEEWDTKIRSALGKKMGKTSARRVPVLPAGHSHSRHLPGYKYWLSRLFVNFEERMKEDGKIGLISINQERLKLDEKDLSDNSKNIEEEDLLFDSTFSTNAKIAAASAAIGVAGAATGASIGATIGALAIGIPTFGVAAGVGLVLGGFISGAAGGTTGAASAKLMHWYVRRKKMKQLEMLRKQ